MPHTRTTLTYRAITWLLFPAAFIYTLFLSLRYRNLRYLKQRLGFFTSRHLAHQPVWLHCASVGEVNTALPLIRALSEKNIQLVVSTSTVTGQEVLQKANLQNQTCIFLPLDYAHFAQQLLNKFQPSALLLFETELWPNIVMTAHRRSVPVAILNGRISHKTLRAPHFVRKNYARVLRQTSAIIASSTENSERFITLGANTDRVSVLDNLKFAFTSKETNCARPLTANYLLCASTHHNEEEQILKNWQSEHLLVLAPRHPIRTKEVCSIVKQCGFDYVLHSQKPTSIERNTVYVIDTLGELIPFMQHAEAVFVGGTLIPLGGHNVLEPASMGKCIIVGPHLTNISAISDELRKQQGIVVVNDSKELCQQYNELQNDSQTRHQLGDCAKAFIQSKQNVLTDYTQAVEKFIANYS